MEDSLADRKLFLARLMVGLAQGLVLYLLYRASDLHVWPATNGHFFAPLLLAWVYVPILLILALGEMPWRKAALWALAAAVVAAGLSLFDNWAAWPVDWGYGLHPTSRPHILNSFQLYALGGTGLFIAHALVVGGQADHRFIASYSRHFDVAWKLAVQLGLAALFVGAFWILLWLGAGLFNLIKLGFFQKLIQHQWFAIPVSTLATAGALHLTDIRPALVRGARTLLLSLLSWLLPLIALIVAGFLASLPFTGLAPLWSFGHASALLLAACGCLVLLTNAAHQDGDPDHLPPKVLRWSGTLAALVTVPLSLIAAYALFLRVQQYGWTESRVWVAASILIACSYAGGYGFAAVMPGPWLQRIERWNFYVSLLILAIGIMLFTPVASPARIAVADQMARLTNGRVAPAKFDFAYLRWHGGRYGQRSLTELAQSKTENIRRPAQAALRSTAPYMIAPAAITPEDVEARMTAYPQGRKIPRAFIEALIRSTNVTPDCRFGAGLRCDLIFVDLDGDGVDEIVLITDGNPFAGVFRDEGSGDWRQAGQIRLPNQCPEVVVALREGRYTRAAPRRPWQEMTAGGMRLHINEVEDQPGPACPTATGTSAPQPVSVAPGRQ